MTSADRAELAKASCALITEWAEKLWKQNFRSLPDVAEYLVGTNYLVNTVCKLHRYRVGKD